MDAPEMTMDADARESTGFSPDDTQRFQEAYFSDDPRRMRDEAEHQRSVGKESMAQLLLRKADQLEGPSPEAPAEDINYWRAKAREWKAAHPDATFAPTEAEEVAPAEAAVEAAVEAVPEPQVIEAAPEPEVVVEPEPDVGVATEPEMEAAPEVAAAVEPEPAEVDEVVAEPEVAAETLVAVEPAVPAEVELETAAPEAPVEVAPAAERAVALRRFGTVAIVIGCLVIVWAIIGLIVLLTRSSEDAGTPSEVTSAPARDVPGTSAPTGPAKPGIDEAGQFTLGPKPVEAVGRFTNPVGSCQVRDFSDRFLFETREGILTLRQLSTGDVTTGPIAPDGSFNVANQKEAYAGQLQGNEATARYTYRLRGCSGALDARFTLSLR